MEPLKKQAASGIKWAGVSTVITIGLQLLQLAIITRLLDPEDFGLMAMITAVIGFAQAFSDMGINNAIIHHRDANREQLSSLYWLNILAGVIIFGFIIALLPFIVSFYHEPRLNGLMPWAALVFLITPIGQQFQVLLQKELKFDCLARVEMAAAAIGTVIAVILVIFGQGIFSLIYGQVASATTKSVLFVRLGWKNWHPGLRFCRDDLKGYIGFGLYQMGERSVNYFSANTDYLVIGRFLGPEALGIYTLAYQLVIMPLSKINPIVTRVAFPLFAKKQSDDTALRRGYLEMLKLLALVMFPILIGLGVTAPLIIPVIFREGWLPAIPLVQILVLVGILKGLANPSGSILLAKGRADIGFKWNVLVTIINTFVFWSVVQYGVYLVAWSYVILSVGYFMLGQMLLRYIIKLGWVEFLAVLIRPTVMSAAMGGTVYTAYLFLAKFSICRLPLLLGLVALGVVLYGLLMVVFESKFLVEIWRLMINKQKEV